jgi:GntR family transcriptional regulator/MocR family aminotransferase
VAVDDEGLRVGDLAALPVGAVVVTPAHQSPTGVVLSARRRTELIDWARDVGGVVIEDDYDAEYRYDRQPVGALQGVIPDRVVYHGTVSKSLAPGLRLGWLVVPPDLLDAVLAARSATDHMTASIVQATFAEFLERGDLDRHLRRTRRVYRQRRDALVDALARWLPGSRVGGVSAGLSVFVTLPPGLDSADVVATAREAGVGVYRIDDDLVPADLRARSLVIGFGTQRPAQITEGVRRLAAALGPRAAAPA